ncbi:MAG: hypothetical protein KJT03_06525 [Verrucomicrobiae bacterium]|nr:hypothetical protein [Verrucomicrobiae bacterium]
MNKHPRTLTVILALAAVAFSNGWHLPIIQGVAWYQMYGNYREALPAGEALQAAMGGEELCQMCKYVRDHTPSSEDKSSTWQERHLFLLPISSGKISLLRKLVQQRQPDDFRVRKDHPFLESQTPPPKQALV